MERKRIGLYIDHFQVPKEIPPLIDEWITLTSYEEVKEWFNTNKYIPELISLGFALSEEYWRWTLSHEIGERIPYEELGHGSCASVTVWLLDLCRKNGFNLNKISIHTPNQLASRQMQKAINEFKPEQDCFLHQFEIEEPSGENYEKFLRIKEEVDQELKEKGLI